MLRVGVIDYVNTLPIFDALRKNVVPHNAVFTFNTPVHINNQLAKNELDVAIISAAHFLGHRLEYVLLSDLGVAATKKVISIRLFSKKSYQELDGNPLYIPSHSASSVKMLKLICKHFWKISPVICPYTGSAEHLFQQEEPFLVIGDECLFLFEQHPEYPSVDLAEIWYNFTKKSCVFALLATRTEAFISKKEAIISFQKSVEASFRWSQENMPEIINQAVNKSKCSRALIEQYFATLEYQLTPKHFHALDYVANL